jgi:hypothetical protein
MKKVAFLLILIVTLISCGSGEVNVSEPIDSTTVDSVIIDSIAVDSAIVK